MPSPLDNPVLASLTGPHARFADARGGAARYDTDISPFLGMAEDAWDDVAALVGPGGVALLAGWPGTAPDGWEVLSAMPGVQLVADGVAGEDEPEAVRLTTADVPEMLDLVARTEPGPFRKGTIELGTYLGIRRGGALVAMAGERMHPPGFTEISAVCTDPAVRGQGLATRLVLALVARIRARGETPFLHAAATNTGAIRLYEALGFVLRREPVFAALRAPQ
ncbi:GNAT family N-acetyltransferase [Amycolatopsis sp. K13G38]|uniref:GNAT family N-acetyltransferase n=1 Tax=Amycolatopsis acididurans TaxID=2724524 RepID=A0ABX1J2T6_9PSEU|nr:GNAT family N-acetyltransferase [Amycolatopsis acididurans]NKQ53944.1 GNAT family N-acetyltransferase [Amycolatopsis acididurans]